jgi:hypothetical protein
MAVMRPAKDGHSSRAPLADRFLERALAVLLVAGGLLFVTVAVVMVSYPREVTVTEGAILEACRRLAGGESLYAPGNLTAPPFLVAQYPPLYYAVTATLVRLFGEGFWAGRLVSSLSSIGTALLVGHVVRRRTGSFLAGTGGSLMYLSFYHVVMWGTTHRVDSLGVLLAVGGLMVYERTREKPLAWLAAAPMFVGALLVKQVIIAAAVAAVLDQLLARRRREALMLGAAVFGSTVAVYLLLTLWSGGGFWTMTVLGTISPEADPPWTIFMNASTFFDSSFILGVLAVAAFLILRGGRPDAWGLMALFGLVWAIATDANIPRFFEPLAAMSVLVASGLASLRREGNPGYRLALLALVIPLAATFLYEERVTIVRERLLNLRPGNSRDRFAEALARHTTPGGDVLAQDIDIVLGARRRVYINDPLVFSILRGNGAWAADVLVEDVRDGRFEAIVLNRPVESLQPDEWITLWIYPAVEAIQENYVLAEVLHSEEHYRFYEPDRYYYIPLR